MEIKTCSDLIEELKKYPKDSDIRVSVRALDGSNTMAIVSEINLIDDTTILLDTIKPDYMY